MADRSVEYRKMMVDSVVELDLILTETTAAFYEKMSKRLTEFHEKDCVASEDAKEDCMKDWIATSMEQLIDAYAAKKAQDEFFKVVHKLN